VLVQNRHNSGKGWALFAFGSALALASAVAEAQVSLVTTVELAQQNSSAVKLAQADVSKAHAALGEARAAYAPIIAFGSGLPFVPSVGFTGGVPSILDGTAQMLVFSLPQRHYIEAARSGLKAATLSLKEAREQVALDASTTYIELDTVNRELDAAHQQEVFADRLVKIEQERAEAGVDPLSSLFEAKLTAAQLKLHRLHLETRASILTKQLAVLTGLPVGSIVPDHSSVPEIPAVKADLEKANLPGIESAQMLAVSKQHLAKGDSQYMFFPQISLAVQYNRSTQILNDANYYYAHPVPDNNFSSGFSIQVPLLDLVHRAKAKESAADALRATAEAEQAQRQNEIQIASITSNLRELDTLAEIADLKKQIAGEQLKTVLTQLELGNGAGTGPGAAPQLSPKSEQLARIDEQQKFEDALDAGLDLSKARLNLLRALGHMEDWLNELHSKQR
jgi:outer membrane protein TolC